MSTESTSDKYHIKKLDNDGLNYSTWAICCQMVLESLDLWDIIDPDVPTSTPPSLPSSSGKPPSSDPSIPADVEWNKKNKKALTVVSGRTESCGLKLLRYLLCLQGSDTEEKESQSSVTSSPNDKQIDPALWLCQSNQDSNMPYFLSRGVWG